jgi:peroxiredoxin Q/BCP
VISIWLSKFYSGGKQMPALEAGAQAPDFTLQDAEGNSYSLAEARKDGPVLLAFYKESCPVCQYTFPFIERIQQGLNGNGSEKVRIWGISQDDAATNRRYAEESGCTFPLLMDEEGYPVSNDYGITNVPSLFLVEPDGNLSEVAVGFEKKALETAAEKFSELSGNPITVFQPTEQIPDYKPG